jgi:hypothetical protein
MQKDNEDDGSFGQPMFKPWEDVGLVRLVQKLRRERRSQKEQPDYYPISKIVEQPQLFQPRDEMLAWIMHAPSELA